MERISVVIIHDNTLVTAGLTKILNEMFNIKPLCYNISFVSKAAFDDCDLIFVSTDIFAQNIDTFMSKKHKCVLISDNEIAETDCDNKISQFWSEEKIINTISRCITRLDEIKTTQNDLSKREIEVLQLIVRGCLNKEIADKLNISINTVLTHRKNITSKLGIKSVSGLSVYAMMNGLM